MKEPLGENRGVLFFLSFGYVARAIVALVMIDLFEAVGTSFSRSPRLAWVHSRGARGCRRETLVTRLALGPAASWRSGRETILVSRVQGFAYLVDGGTWWWRGVWQFCGPRMVGATFQQVAISQDVESRAAPATTMSPHTRPPQCKKPPLPRGLLFLRSARLGLRAYLRGWGWGRLVCYCGRSCGWGGCRGS